MAKIRAGDLRHRITIQQRSQAQDAYGGQVATWTDYAINVPARISPLSGRELMLAQAARSLESHEIEIRYKSGVTSAMRAVYKSRVFNFINVDNEDERNTRMLIHATEGATA